MPGMGDPFIDRLEVRRDRDDKLFELWSDGAGQSVGIPGTFFTFRSKSP